MTPLRVLFVPHASEAAEERAAWSWLEDTAAVRARRAPATELDAAADFKPHVIWVHATSRVAGRDPDLGQLKALAQRGRFLLTGGAATLPIAFGLEPEPPNEVSRHSWPEGAAANAGAPDAAAGAATAPGGEPLLGHATLHGHPLFDGLGSSACTWRPRAGEEYTVVAYRPPAWPMNARVIAVERGGRRINPDRATIWEFMPEGDAPDGPRTLCIGAYLPFTSSDAGMRPRLERLAHNALFYAAGRTAKIAAADGGAPMSGGGAAVDAPEGGRIVLGWRPRASRPQQEAALAIPEPPVLADPLPPFDSELRLDGAASVDTPFTLAGRRAAVIGDEASGVDELWLHPLCVLRSLRLDGADAREVEVTPVGVRRSLRVRGRPVAERIFVPRDGAAAIVEWTVDPDGVGSTSAPVELRLSWTAELRLAPPYPAGSLGALRWRREGRALLVRSEPSEDRAYYALSRMPATWDIAVGNAAVGREDAAHAASASVVRSEVSVRLAPGETIRLTIAGAADPDGLDRVLDRLRRPAALVRARTAADRRRRARGLALTAAGSHVGGAVQWAQYRLGALAAEARGVGPTLITGFGATDARPGTDGVGRLCSTTADAAWAAHAFLCVGDAETPRDVLRFLGRHQDPSGRPPSGSTLSALTHYDDADATPAYLLLAARYAAWTGDLGFIGEEWPRIEHAAAAWAAGGIAGRAAGSGAGLARAALRELADIAESLGRDGFAAELRGHADEAPGGPAALAHACGSESWAAFSAGRADTGYRRWRAHAERGLERRGAWTDAEAATGTAGSSDALATAMVIVPLVYGLLGAEPDAPKGRLRLRPQVPQAWDRLRVDRLRIGGSELELRYGREGSRHRFRLEQTRGAVPLTIVFEPALPGRRVSHASVDGRAAVLDPRTFGERVLVPLQVVLDHERVIELDIAD